jgi:peptide deformylase
LGRSAWSRELPLGHPLEALASLGNERRCEAEGVGVAAHKTGGAVGEESMSLPLKFHRPAPRFRTIVVDANFCFPKVIGARFLNVEHFEQIDIEQNKRIGRASQSGFALAVPFNNQCSAHSEAEIRLFQYAHRSCDPGHSGARAMQKSGESMFTILEAGDPVLRQIAQPLSPEEILSESTQVLIEMMGEMMRSAPGVGLAAPQIGVSVQVLVIEDRPEYHLRLTEEELRERERVSVPFHVLINPILNIEDGREVRFFEGCLSVPGYQAIVPRAYSVRVDALDGQAQPITIQAQGWYARILQHEIDHLHGTLCIDRMQSCTLTSHENYKRFWQGKSKDEILDALSTSKNTESFQDPANILR